MIRSIRFANGGNHVRAEQSKVDHVAFEVIDLDAVEMGQQVMMAGRYRHAWGVAWQPDLRLLARSLGPEARALRRRRSVRYRAAGWISPHGPRRPLSLGPDLPDDFLDTRMTPSRLLRLIRRSLKDRSYLRKMMGFKKALAQPVRA